MVSFFSVLSLREMISRDDLPGIAKSSTRLARLIAPLPPPRFRKVIDREMRPVAIEIDTEIGDYMISNRNAACQLETHEFYLEV